MLDYSTRQPRIPVFFLHSFIIIILICCKISGPRLDLDPDIVAALDEDFDYDDPENELEDNFMELANAEGPDSEYNSEDDSNFNDYSDEDRDEICSLNGPQYTFADEETKSRFTEYSMSSSVIRRNEQLTLLDDRFEKVLFVIENTSVIVFYLFRCMKLTMMAKSVH